MTIAVLALTPTISPVELWASYDILCGSETTDEIQERTFLVF